MLIKHAHFHNDDLYRVLKYMTVNEAQSTPSVYKGFIDHYEALTYNAVETPFKFTTSFNLYISPLN